MATIGPKEAWLREMRERQHAERKVAGKPVSKQAKLREAKSAVKSHVTDNRVTDNSVTDKRCVICNKPFEAKRADAKVCSAACRMRKRRADAKK